MKKYQVVGIMSGTSMDGLDLVLCSFFRYRQKWSFNVIKAVTTTYSSEWKKNLEEADRMNNMEFLLLHNAYGRYIGQAVNSFLGGDLRASLVASHGHTIYHQPDRGFTFQLGHGSAIASTCRITTIADFRTMDVMLGGQGAPLVPIGDKLLFGNYDFCLNLGGFANISGDIKGIRTAWDICPVNFIINRLVRHLGHDFDPDGTIGRTGKIIPELTGTLNKLAYYQHPGPKSLGREWVDTYFMPVVHQFRVSVEDMIRSIYEHIAIQISQYMNALHPRNVLVTGGGAFNVFLIELIRQKTDVELVVPNERLIKYKEAIIFAFLGLLRYKNDVNCLASVTGAESDSSSGVIYLI